ncbi:MAG: alcohol dehydrogenase catalytic domain-containing protein [Planctomycetota bacterium]
MKALRRQAREERAVALEEVAEPIPGPGQVLLRVQHCGVCGSDLHVYLNHKGYESVLPQVTLGHEWAGLVMGWGEGVDRWSQGQPATMIALQGCLGNECSYCCSGLTQLCPERRVQGLHLDGGMAELVVVDDHYLLPLPEGIDTKAASLTEPLSVADHCINDCSEIESGDRVVVCGPGVIGILCALLARKRGADVVITGLDADEPVRLATARGLGFETMTVGGSHASLTEQLAEQKIDVLVDASGSSRVLEEATGIVRPDGTICVVALYPQEVTLDFNVLVRNQIDLRTCYASSKPNYENAIEFLHGGEIPIDQIVRCYPLVDGVRAFEEAERQEVLKPILTCSS